MEFFIHTSSSEVYGTAQWVPIDETHPLHAQSPYAATKTAADQLAQSFHLSYGLPVATIRPFNTFGPRQSPRAVIPTIITQALQEDSINLGSLDPIRDFTFVLDTVNAFVLMATKNDCVGQVVNVGTGRGVSIGDAAAIVLRLVGNKAEVALEHQRLRPADSEVLRLICDASKAREILGWEPNYTFEEGLLRVIEFECAQSTHSGREIYAV